MFEYLSCHSDYHVADIESEDLTDDNTCENYSLKTLGICGWELVTCFSWDCDGHNRFTYIFKKKI